RVARLEYLPLIGKPQEKAKAGRILRQQIQPLFRQHRLGVEDTARLAAEVTRHEEEAAAADTRFWTNAMLVLSVLSVLALGVLGWLLAHGIVRAADVLIARVNEMAGGASDLTARVPVDSRDEMGRLAAGINALIAKIQAVVTRVREATLQVLAT